MIRFVVGIFVFSVMASATSGNVNEIRVVKRYVEADDFDGSPAFAGEVADLYVLFDTPDANLLGVSEFTILNPSVEQFYQSVTASGWMPNLQGGLFETDAAKYADSFVTIGARNSGGSPSIDEDGEIVQPWPNGTSIGQSFGGNQAPVPSDGASWFNTNPNNLIGSPLIDVPGSGELGVLIARFSILGNFPSCFEGQVELTWNYGPGTSAAQAQFLIGPLSPADSDGDGVTDCYDLCPADSNKVRPGICGCGVPDTDSDEDGVADCLECPSDITGNGVVDGGDLGILLSLWGTDGKSNPNADINQDGFVDGADLGLILGYWGICP